MTVRSDITVNWDLSPRIITILSGSTELTLQDLVDTARDLEDELQNLDNDILITAAGKNDLGGGLSVDITAELQNAQVSFEARSLVLSTGSITTATSPSTSGTISLIDTNATFLSEDIARQDIVVDWDGRSFGAVEEVVSNTQIQVIGLSGALDNNFDVNDAYSIHPVDQCSIAGGNLVAVDSGSNSISSVYQAFGTQIVRTSSASATRVNQESLEFASFGAGVAIDPISGSTGTAFPMGTLQSPVNNIDDALSIAQERGLVTLYMLRDFTLESGDDISGKVITGLGSRNGIKLTVNGSVNVDDTRFEDFTLSGTFLERCHFEHCVLEEVTFSGEFIESCAISGNLTLTGSIPVIMKNCIDADPGSGTPTVDLQNYNGTLNIREYYGGIEITNKVDTGTIAIGLATGRVIVGPTVVSGTVRIRGIGEVVDTAANTATIISSSLISNTYISDSVWDKVIPPEHTGSNTAGEFLFGAGGGSSPSAIADAVWDESFIGHTGSSDAFGTLLLSASSGGGSDPSTIADAVWNTVLVGHTGSNTFGEMVAKKLLKFSLWIALK